MELENSQNNALAKLPMLKLGEYEMWEIRIKQYFQIQDYALWEVIENGNSWVPIPVTTPESGPSTALKMTVPSTTEEKICKKNDVKARKMDLKWNMALLRHEGKESSIRELKEDLIDRIGLDEFKQPEVNEYRSRDSSLKPTTVCDRESDNSKENTDDSLKQQHKTVTETSSVKSSLKVDKDWKEKFFYPANHAWVNVEPKQLVRE
ncbi:hypothetical protein Tco_0601588 [Tanacetum coccineum]